MALYPLSQSAVYHRRNTYATLERVVEAWPKPASDRAHLATMATLAKCDMDAEKYPPSVHYASHAVIPDYLHCCGDA